MMFLKMLGAVCAVPVLLLVVYYLATWNTAKIQPEQMEAWDRELPVLVEPATAHTQTTKAEWPPPPPKKSEAPAKRPVLTLDFAAWLHSVKPEASRDDRIVAWQGFEEGINYQGWTSISGRYREIRSNAGRVKTALIEQFTTDCAQFMASRRAKLETLDRILGGGPLPWPSADEFDTLLMHHFDKQIWSFRWHACDLAIADAALAVKSDNSVFPAIERLAAIDRRFSLESDAGIFLHNPASTLDLLSELVGEPGIGLFDPARVSASNATVFLARFPEPILDSLERRRSMLRRKFMSDRAIRADPEKGWEYFYLEEWRRRGIIPTARGGANEGIIALMAEVAHYNELALIYRWKKQDYIQSVFDHQKRIDEAIVSGRETIEYMIEDVNQGIRAGTYDHVEPESEYLGLANDSLRISDYNDQRLMLHAVMIARAAGDDSAQAMRDVRGFSANWGNRVDVAQTSAGLRLSIGARAVVVPVGSR